MYYKKTVKKNSTKIYGKKSGAALALKVTPKDKVANYKATIKAQVYNKSNHKKVGSLLKTTTTVKCTKLKVTDVTVASTSGKYLVATFNKALSKLSVADVVIRNTETNELKGVEKVELASDGKSATITLVGTEDLDAMGNLVNDFIEPNTDYTFIVNQSNATASTIFNIDGVVASATIDKVDAKKRTINVINGQGGTIPTGTYTVPSSIAVDFEEILGKTVTISVDKNANITSLKEAKETVVYAELKVNKYTTTKVSDVVLKDKATGTEYALQIKSGRLYPTHIINKDGNAGSAEDAAPVAADTLSARATTDFAPATTVDYAKLVLYPNGKVRTVVLDKTYTDKILVDKVVETVVSAATKTSVNLKDFTILKDGKSITIADIVPGDMVFYDLGNKFADVYTSSKTGALQEVYNDKFKFNDTIYNTTDVKRLNGNNGVKNADNDYMKALLKGAKDITVYFDRANDPVFVTGTPADVVSTTTAMVLTEKQNDYTSALAQYITIKGFNGTEITTETVNVADLEFICTSSNNLFKVGAVSSNVDNGRRIYTVSGFAISNGGADGGNDLTLTAAVTENSIAGIDDDLVAPVLDLNTVGAESVIEITRNDKNKIIGLSYKNKVGTVTSNFVAGKTSIQYDANADGSVDGALQIAASVPVFTWTNATTVSKTTYGEFKGTTAGDNATVYSSDGKNVNYIVVKSVVDETVNYFDAVVSTSLKNTDKKVTYLEVYVGNELKKYTTFSSAAADTTESVATGAIVRLGLASDGTTVQSITSADGDTTTTVACVSTSTVNDNAFKTTGLVSGNSVGSSYDNVDSFELTSTGTVTIVKLVKDDNGVAVAVKPITFGELAQLSAANRVVINALGGTSYVENIVVSVE